MALVCVITGVALGAAAPAVAADGPPIDRTVATPAGAASIAHTASGVVAQAPEPKPRVTGLVAIIAAGVAAVVLLAVLFRHNLIAAVRYVARGGRTRPEDFFAPSRRPVAPPEHALVPAEPEPPPEFEDEPEPEPVGEVEPEPVAEDEPETEPEREREAVRGLETEPHAVITTEPAAAGEHEVEPEPAAAVDSQHVAAPAGEDRVEPESAHVAGGEHEVEPEAAPLSEVGPEPVVEHGVEPEPVAEVEREPVAAAEHEAEPEVEPDSARRPATPVDATNREVVRIDGPRREHADAPRTLRGDHNGGAGGPPRTIRPAAAAARNAPVCQVHWIERGSRFTAKTIDDDGVEHRLASSPPIASPVASPPEQTPETERALRQLAKDLRERGWKPLRAKGTDFDEPQWYARRFKRPPPEGRAEGAEGGAPPISTR